MWAADAMVRDSLKIVKAEPPGRTDLPFYFEDSRRMGQGIECKLLISQRIFSGTGFLEKPGPPFEQGLRRHSKATAS